MREIDSRVTLAGFDEPRQLLPDPGDGAVAPRSNMCNHFCEGRFVVRLDLICDDAGLRVALGNSSDRGNFRGATFGPCAPV